MKKFYASLIKRRKIIIALFVCVAAVCGFLMIGVNQNYDMSKYLPQDTQAKVGIDILKNEYSYNGNAVLLLEQKSIVETLEIKGKVESIEGVEKVIWLDDIADLKQPVELINKEIANNYIVGNDSLLQIIFTHDDYAKETRQAIIEIKSLLGSNTLIAGSAVDAYNNINMVNNNILVGILAALAIILLILFLSTNSLFEVILFLITIGIAILLNMGTNIIFGEISYMTFATAAVLQLAISMDYSIFLLHRFELERKSQPNAAKAMVNAVKASFSSIVSSGMTTIVGFVALLFMSYTIGTDMGLVLGKGILFSLICVMFLLPTLAVACVKAIDKTKHKKLLPSMKKVQHILGGKIKYVVIGILVVVSVITFMAQNNNSFLYSSSNGGTTEQDEINNKIEQRFGDSNNFVILVSRGNEVAEYNMAKSLKLLTSVKSVQGYYAFIDPTMPQEIVPDNIKSEFLSVNYSRYIVEVDAQIESKEAFAAVEEIRSLVSASYKDAIVTGASPVVYDIRNTASGDFSMVALLSILFVGIILLITFRSLSLPIILLFVIQTSIWINMAIPYFSGTSMIFIGFMVISAVQLGATIDYAILMTNYYKEGRKTLSKREASEYAADKAGASILVSTLVLAAAGFVVAATFTQPAMSQLGTLIGRGALLSGGMTIILLPQLLILLDKVIKKTTLKRKLFLRRNKNEAQDIHDNDRSNHVSMLCIGNASQRSNKKE